MKISGLSDRGMVRVNNEDTYGIRMTDAAYFGVVCDGMGGGACGNKASSLATKNILDSMESQLKEELSPTDVKSILRSVIRSANLQIYDEAAAHSECRGMGTTAVAFVYIRGIARAFFVNVGDSRAYLIRGGCLTQITNDHSLVYEMVEKGHITKEEARHHPNRNIITRAIGTDAELHPDTFEIEIQKGDRVLLCSDGLHGMLSEEDILTAVLSSDDVEKAVTELVNCANIAGGSDNITALLALFDEEGEQAYE